MTPNIPGMRATASSPLRSTRILLALAAMLAAAVAMLSVPSRAEAVRNPVVGIGEQGTAVFSDPFYKRLRIRHVRYVVGWDSLRFPAFRSQIDAWMAEARAARQNVLLAFNVSRDADRHDIVPTVAQYRRAFLGFRKRYPFVREFISWNEGNHSSQPTARRPELGARYFDAAQRACPRCKIVAADLLDDESIDQWVRRFRRAARAPTRIWGLHNYIDANKFTTRGTRSILDATGSGQVWFTETGGIVWRRGGIRLPSRGVRHAGRATRFVFRLANLSPRVKRAYFYHWTFPEVLDRWDSAIMNRQGRPRPAYRVLRNQIRSARRRAAA
jgi:hypothetical protein